MSPSREFLERRSAETGYPAASLEKVVRLGDMAGDIARHPLLGEALALKGGTALNLCFAAPKRLSVDLDFNYIHHLNREKMLEEKPQVEAAVIRLAERKGYRIQPSADAFAGRKYHLLYRSVFSQEDRIEIDLNFLFRMPLSGTEERELWQPGGLERPQLRVVSAMEILIGKLLALLDRGALRDLWDIANIRDFGPADILL
jgi:hypothetical protein